MGAERLEYDSLGTIAVPSQAYWGTQTARSIRNFPISKQRLSDYSAFIRALALVKQAAAVANGTIGRQGDAGGRHDRPAAGEGRLSVGRITGKVRLGSSCKSALSGATYTIGLDRDSRFGRQAGLCRCNPSRSTFGLREPERLRLDRGSRHED